MSGKELFIESSERFWLYSCATVVFLSVVLSTTPEVVSFLGFDVPTLCPFRWLSGLDCYGCGLTRSFVFMGHGELSSAFGVHKLGPVLFSFVAGQIPWRIFRLWRHRRSQAATNKVY